MKTKYLTNNNVVILVAHPDDETLWAGGVLLENPSWNVFIVSLCRGSDGDRAPKFKKVLKKLEADGKMDDLDDGPEQNPLNPLELERSMVRHLPSGSIDLLITHSPFGEYTRHRRHEEIGNAVISLWKNAQIKIDELWLFAYEDGNRAHYPTPIAEAHQIYVLSEKIRKEKYRIITEIYGFAPESWEALACPEAEAFWQFSTASKAYEWQQKTGRAYEYRNTKL